MMEHTKENMLKFYRDSIAPIVLKALEINKNAERSRLINSNMKVFLSELLENQYSLAPNLSDLDYVLMAHYTYYIVMLESRNKVWNYDYMSFSRRVGELWEPFCKIPFDYSKNNVSFYIPISYEEYKSNYKIKVENYINSLMNSSDEKDYLKKIFNEVWDLTDSGLINLSEDLHFESNAQRYVVDFKSGFSSNEKGNVNRLLQVGKIYSTMGYKCLIFVRQKEIENNHYLQTLKNSGLWDVYCSDDTYAKIFEITGIDIKSWMSVNMHWEEDISIEFKKYLNENKLLQYLAW